MNGISTNVAPTSHRVACKQTLLLQRLFEALRKYLAPRLTQGEGTVYERSAHECRLHVVCPYCPVDYSAGYAGLRASHAVYRPAKLQRRGSKSYKHRFCGGLTKIEERRVGKE